MRFDDSLDLKVRDEGDEAKSAVFTHLFELELLELLGPLLDLISVVLLCIMLHCLLAESMLFLKLLDPCRLIFALLSGLIRSKLICELDVSILALLIPERQSTLVKIYEDGATPR